MPERKRQTIKKALIPTKESARNNRLKIAQTARELKGHQVTSFATAKKKKRPPKK